MFEVEPPEKPCPEMDAAVAWLIKAGVDFFVASKNQLKIDTLSFYPRSGTLNYDGEKREPVRGLSGLRKLLQKTMRRELPPID